MKVDRVHIEGTITKILEYKDIDHLGCIDCENFDGDREMEVGNCKGELKEFCRRYFL